ncbi:alpha/beta hydrolase [soil metagenome]
MVVPVRGFDYHLQCWGDPSLVTAERPALFMLHGWMDVGASFQFLVDALEEQAQAAGRFIVAPDWRGFGLTRSQGIARTDTYWFPDYLADLEVLLHAVFEGATGAGLPVDLLGHSMGGNVATMYAGIRPSKIRRLVNLEGFGMPATQPADAPERYRRWLDELAQPATLASYDSLDAVARRLQRNNAQLTPDRALWLARHWASETGPGEWRLNADPAHKHVTPVLYQKEEVLKVWEAITAPMLWIEGSLTDTSKFWGNRYTRDEFSERLTHVAKVERHVVGPAAHMVHHDQPAQIAHLLEVFLLPG